MAAMDTETYLTEPIAIIGMSCRFAGDATNPERFWDMLAQGRNAWSEIPSARFNPKGVFHPDPEKLNTSHVKGAHFLKEDIALFDAAFFSLSGEMASAMDPQYRLLLESAYEALENAGLTLSSVAGSNTSVYAGVFTHDYHEGIIRDEDNLPRFLPIGTFSAIASNRISHFFDLRGPSMTVDTGCSTGLVALHQAVLGLRAGESDMAIVGGCNLMITPDVFKVFSSLGMVGPDGKSYAFDARANGYGRGEGVGTLVVKRLKDAVAAGDPIRAVIRETCLNQDGRTETITSPSQEAQEALIRECYRRAGLDPRDTSYFEAHGTGTATGDPIEARAIAAVFGSGTEVDPCEEPLRIGSVKTNIGHTEAASGLAALIKVVLSMEQGLIPPSANFDKPNKKFELDRWGLKVATQLEPWPATDGKPLRASVNNFGYGGTNSHCVVEDARKWRPPAPPGKMDPKAHPGSQSALLLLYGRDERACRSMVANTREYLLRHQQEAPDLEFGTAVALMRNLSWTLATRRSRLPWLAGGVVQLSLSDNPLRTVFESLDSPAFQPVRVPAEPARIGMVFTGQGAQWHAMGRELINGFPIFRSTLYAAEKHLKSFGAKWSLIEELARDEETTQVYSTAISVPICVAVQIALVRLLRSWAVWPTAVTSHSSGEIPAAYAAGALTLREAMAVAYYRSAIADDFLRFKSKSSGEPKGAMIAVGVGVETALEYLDRVPQDNGKAVVACINSPRSVTIAGDEAAIKDVEALATAHGVFARVLRVETAYHSHHMHPIAEPYQQALTSILGMADDGEDEDENKSEIPDGAPWAMPYRRALAAAVAVEDEMVNTGGHVVFFSPVTGGRLASLEQLSDPDHWVRSLLQPVRFVEAFTDMILGGGTNGSRPSVDAILEVGPHTALGSPIKEMLEEPEFQDHEVTYVGCPLVRNENARDTVRAAALGLERNGVQSLRWTNVLFPWGRFPISPSVLTDLPPYPWTHNVRHWSEARQNKAYRQRDQEPHALLGTLVPGTNPEAATWRHRVRISDNNWLRDHVVQGHVLYPGAGFVCLAIEAIKQLTDMADDSSRKVSGFRLRDVEILQALAVPEGAEGVEMQTVVRSTDARAIGSRGWKQFEVLSVTPESQWTLHSKGLIFAEFDTPPPPPADLVISSGLTRRVEPDSMFAQLRASGLHHGPMFQNTTSIAQDARSGQARCTTTIKVADAGQENKYLLHPTTLDSVFLSSYAALSGDGEATPKVPRSISSVWVSSRISGSAGNSLTCRTEIGHRDARSYNGDAIVVDGTEKMLELKEFVGQSLGFSGADAAHDKEPWTKELCSEVRWSMHLPLSLGLPGALPKVKVWLTPAQEMDPVDKEVLIGLRRVCVYFSHDALKALTQRDLVRLKPHHVKFHSWMKGVVSLAASRQLGPSSDTWIRDGPQKRQRHIAHAAAQSVDGELIFRLGPLLVSILRGEREALEAMMEERLLYKYYANAFRMRRAFAQFTALLRAVAHQNPRARVLEIGAGTGAATRHAFRAFGGTNGEQIEPPCETWHFTDVSSGFFEAARTEFASFGEALEFDRLDIEQSPESQGFHLESYDVVVACQVLHATRSMARTMKHVRSLMKPGATLLLMETTQDQVDLQFIFGLLPGWWLSEEGERTASPTLTGPAWDRVLRDAGFSGVDLELRDCPNNEDLYCVSNILSTASVPPSQQPPDSVVVVTSAKSPPPAPWLQALRESIAAATGGSIPAVQPLEARGQFASKLCVFVGEMEDAILHSLTDADLQGVRAMTTGCKGLLWVTRGAAVECEKPEHALAAGFLRALRSEYAGRHFLMLDLDPNTVSWSKENVTVIAQVLRASSLGTPNHVDLPAIEPPATDSEFALRNGLILVPRLFKDSARNKSITPGLPNWADPDSIPEDRLFQDDRPLRLNVGIPGLLDTLAFDDDREAEPSPAADMVHIEPRAYGLNFRDVMVAMGQLRERVMGLECAGVVTRVGKEAASRGFAVGDRVMALLLGPFASQARVSWHGVVHMPEDMAFEDAASLPMIFSTAYVALVEVARLRQGQSVLIHAAAGGVGQAAIMLAKKLLGAEVYATVGSQEKRELLVGEYGIPPERIFNSRDTSFANDVVKATGGRGVDVVLNSLAGPLLQAGFDVLAPFGHFVEIGKKDLEDSNLLSMGQFSRVASFTSIDMMSLLRERGPHAHRVLSEVAQLAKRNIIGPIHPVTVFPMSQVAKAFRLLQTGKHTGKVVLSVSPSEEVKVLPREPTPRLRGDASYLLVGGVGGLGKSIAYWMVDHGARNLILLSRGAGKRSPDGFIAQLRDAGCRVVTVSCDAADKAELNRALNRCQHVEGLPPIRGVVQGAMVLSDAILEHMTIEDWQRAIRPKVAGSHNLHQRFSRAGSLDFFVMLSSLSAILGWASQSNYAAGGSYQDALATYRQARGLPAVSLDLGIVTGVGYVAESRAASDRLRGQAQSLRLSDQVVLRAISAAILRPFDKPQMLLGLHCGPGSQWDPTTDSQMGRDARFTPLRYRKPCSKQAGESWQGADNDVKPLSARLQEAASHDEATQAVGDAIVTKLGDIFMIPAEDIDLTKPPALYGVDSLVAVELRNMLMLQAASDVSIFTILQSGSLAALAEDVVAKSSHFEVLAAA
ncbi:hypothetical protein QBC34DRAFT_440144 [Podospora aff. communis PSN243]|uniref:Polyketide synthase n=1 Tax=Podospora aff. communis PSN243 TaxID=3040156 RepID=A0AAV9GHA3_9PEZI|nr:hypothetical protein QBC34DRAFT_440144 [Podospora aff. communis PSN243]